MIFSTNLDYAGVVPLVDEKSSLHRVIIKLSTDVVKPNRHYFKAEIVYISLSQTCVLRHVNYKPPVCIYPPSIFTPIDPIYFSTRNLYIWTKLLLNIVVR